VDEHELARAYKRVCMELYERIATSADMPTRITASNPGAPYYFPTFRSRSGLPGQERTAPVSAPEAAAA
jgi:hypothetical protein